MCVVKCIIFKSDFRSKVSSSYIKRHSLLGRGQMVSMLAFYSDDRSSNP